MKSGSTRSTPGISAIGEHHPAVEDDEAALLFENRAVAADLPEAAEEGDPDRLRHAGPQLRSPTSAARNATTPARRAWSRPSARASPAPVPSGGGTRPPGGPSTLRTAFVGSGFGASSLDWNATASISAAFSSRAPSTSPSRKRRIISPSSWPIQCDATLTTPTAPIASRGRVSGVVAAVAVEACPGLCHEPGGAGRVAGGVLHADDVGERSTIRRSIVSSGDLAPGAHRDVVDEHGELVAAAIAPKWASIPRLGGPVVIGGDRQDPGRARASSPPG